jgi:hypothetical protein
MVSSVLQATPVDAEKVFDSARYVYARLVQVALSQGTEERDRRSTRRSAFLENLIERWELVNVSRRILSIESFLPMGQWIRLPEHKATDDKCFDIREVPEHP